MRLDDENPLFRKAITPWYDSNWVCWMVLIVMVILILFSWAGFVVARSNPAYHKHTWVPALMLILSLWVAGSIIYRLIHRFHTNRSQFKEP